MLPDYVLKRVVTQCWALYPLWHCCYLHHICITHIFYLLHLKAPVMADIYETIASLIKEMDILKLWIKICHNKEQISSNLGRNVGWLWKTHYSRCHIHSLLILMTVLRVDGNTSNIYVTWYMTLMYDRVWHSVFQRE